MQYYIAYFVFNNTQKTFKTCEWHVAKYIFEWLLVNISNLAFILHTEQLSQIVEFKLKTLNVILERIEIMIGSNISIFLMIACFYEGVVISPVLLVRVFFIFSQPDMLINGELQKVKVEISGMGLGSCHLELSVEGRSICFGNNTVRS